MSEASGSTEAKSVRGGKLPVPVRILLSMLLLVVLFINPVIDFANRIINQYIAGSVIEYLSANLPEQTDAVEAAGTSSMDPPQVLLLIKTDLSENRISEYYKNLRIQPLDREYTVVDMMNPEDYRKFGDWFGPGTDFVESWTGTRKVQIINPGSSHKDYYLLFIQQSSPREQ